MNANASHETIARSGRALLLIALELPVSLR